MTQDAIRIVPLAANQHAEWLPLWRAYQAFYKVDIPADVTALTWSRLLDEKEPMGAALAWDGANAVGMVHHIQHRSCWTAGDYLYLQDLYVVPVLRGRGVGRRLIEYVYGIAKQRSCARVHWLTHESNTDAMHLYDRIAQKSGFVQYRHVIE
jgi:GNAT superfamily N-acetyltransferase